jgi:hypothetical protein
LFLGYFVSPGGRWRGDFLVARLADFKDPALKKVQVQRVKEVYMQPCSVEDIYFPVKARHEQLTRSLVPLSDDAELVIPRPASSSSSSDVKPAEETPAKGGAQNVELLEGRRPVRKYKGTQRPEGVWPEIWQTFTPKKRRELLEEIEKQKQQGSEAAANAILKAHSHPGFPCALAITATTQALGELVVPFPAMPCTPSVKHPHRDKIQKDKLLFSALVARTVSRKEVRSNPKALAALCKKSGIVLEPKRSGTKLV